MDYVAKRVLESDYANFENADKLTKQIKEDDLINKDFSKVKFIDFGS